jgi:hypothetical protein
MRLVALLLGLSAIWLASSALTGAATPVTATAVATETPEAPAATPAAEPSPRPAAFTVSGRLVVDENGNGAADDADTAPVLVYLSLLPWSMAHRLVNPDPASDISGLVVALYSAPDGSFSFDNVPADSYTMRVHWPTGFATKGAVSTAPFWWRAAFRITETGEIGPRVRGRPGGPAAGGPRRRRRVAAAALRGRGATAVGGRVAGSARLVDAIRHARGRGGRCTRGERAAGPVTAGVTGRPGGAGVRQCVAATRGVAQRLVRDA